MLRSFQNEIIVSVYDPERERSTKIFSPRTTGVKVGRDAAFSGFVRSFDVFPIFFDFERDHATLAMKKSFARKEHDNRK